MKSQTSQVARSCRIRELAAMVQECWNRPIWFIKVIYKNAKQYIFYYYMRLRYKRFSTRWVEISSNNKWLTNIILSIPTERIYSMADFKYEIVEHIGTLSESAKGWTKELNRISWNGGEPKYDIRDWAPEHEKMGKGVTLSEDEMLKLKELL